MLIEIDDENMGLFDFVGIKLYLEEKLGAPVDLVEPEGLSKYIKDDVLREAEPVYEA